MAGGIKLCKRLRKAKSQALILMMNARDTIDNKTIGSAFAVH